MKVEQQNGAVLAIELTKASGRSFRVAVVGLAVGQVDDDRRKAGRMLRKEPGEERIRAFEGGAHRRLAIGHGLEPDGKLDRLLHLAALAIVDEVDALLDTQGTSRDFADRNEIATCKRTAQARRD